MSGLKNTTTKYNTFKKYNKSNELNKMRNIYDLYGQDKQSYYNEVYNDIIDKETKTKNRMIRDSLKNMRKNYFIHYLKYDKKTNDNNELYIKPVDNIILIR